MATGRNLSSKISLWQTRTVEHEEKQLINPFSNWEGASHRCKLSKTDVNYGKPVEGSQTDKRGKKAGELVSSEIIELCRVIAEIGEHQPDKSVIVRFGLLFETYTHISNKLVGMLMRARKQQLLHFEGEMLYQRRDDDVVITLFKVPEPE